MQGLHPEGIIETILALTIQKTALNDFLQVYNSDRVEAERKGRARVSSGHLGCFYLHRCCPPHDAATQRVFAPALPSLLPLQPPLSPDSPSDLCEFDDVYRLINIDLRPFFSLSGFKNQTCILTPRRYIMSVGKNKRLSKGYVRNSNSCKTIVVEEVRCDLTCRPSNFSLPL